MARHYRYRMETEKSWAETIDEIARVMHLWGVDEWQIEPRRPTFGGARAGQSPRERLVVLDYIKDGAPVSLTMDKQARAVDNLRVLYLAIDAMRLNEVRGIADVVRTAYLQLPAPVTERNPYEVLGMSEDSDMDVIEAVYRTLVRKLHPDAPGGGDAKKMQELTQAMDRIRKERGT